ncbi:hypothetical protein GT3570_11350 [Geobacillus thermoleovorans]|uniref:hypothetical protein n=1 Tax=Geobacillus thermoleovorans TaxID=33941 RepID=UPI00078D20A0|nr:hypothetical protein GT3570_11350 [Geobacillus thermoleovorans]
MFRVIVQSVRRFREWANYTPEIKKPTHADKIKELQTDELVSKEYLQSLINASRKKTDLQEILKYLNDKAKTANLNTQEIAKLKWKISEKIDTLDMKEMLKQFREGGHISLTDWWDYFV